MGNLNINLFHATYTGLLWLTNCETPYYFVLTRKESLVTTAHEHKNSRAKKRGKNSFGKMCRPWVVLQTGAKVRLRLWRLPPTSSPSSFRLFAVIIIANWIQWKSLRGRRKRRLCQQSQALIQSSTKRKKYVCDVSTSSNW